MLRDRPPRLDRAAAETITASALAFLAGDPERLGRFLSLTGIGPAEIRSQAREPGFLAGVAEFVLSDEDLLVAFATAEGFAPEHVGTALRLIDGSLGR